MDNLTEKIKKNFLKAEAEKNYIDKSIKTQKEIEKEIEKRIKGIQEAQVYIQTMAKKTQEKLRFHIEDIVQSILDTCFENKYKFKIIFEMKRGSTEANLYLEDNENNLIDPLTEAGGGIVDIISLGLRLAALIISKTDRILILDEPFKFLSTNLRSLAGEILSRICKDLKLQVICVSHDQSLIEMADKIFEVDQKDGRSFLK